MTNKNNERYSTELKATAIKKMMPPENRGIRQLSQTLGIPEATLYSWRKKHGFRGKRHQGKTCLLANDIRHKKLPTVT